MILKYELSELALEDVNSIWEYTILNWSIEQAEKYYNELFDGVNLICQNPKIGKSINEVKENYRSKVVRQHMIIYKIQNDIIFIDRILHERMDFNKHFDE